MASTKKGTFTVCLVNVPRMSCSEILARQTSPAVHRLEQLFSTLQ